MGNHSTNRYNPTSHPVSPHLSMHQYSSPYSSSIPSLNATHLDNQQNSTSPEPCPYDINSTYDGTPYDPWPDSWGHSPSDIQNDTLRLFLKNPNGIMSIPGQACPKLIHGLQDMADLGAGMILLNEINCDTKQSDVRDTYKVHLDKHWV